jgi:hypothetical protein
MCSLPQILPDHKIKTIRTVSNYHHSVGISNEISFLSTLPLLPILIHVSVAFPS